MLVRQANSPAGARQWHESHASEASDTEKIRAQRRLATQARRESCIDGTFRNSIRGPRQWRANGSGVVPALHSAILAREGFVFG